MKITETIKKLFKKEHITTFAIDSDSPTLEIGSLHEDNKWFHGTKFEVLSVTEVEEHPEERWQYTIKGTCKVLER